MKQTICLLFLFIAAGLSAQQPEFIDWDKATINNKLTMSITKRDFDAIYKKADSIVKPDYSKLCEADADSKFRYVYYKGAMFEEDNGVMNFRYIILSKKSGMFFTHKGVRFDAATTQAQFAKVFPNTSAVLEDGEFGKMKNLKVALFPTRDPEDGIWKFYFSNGLLVAIECYFPCE